MVVPKPGTQHHALGHGRVPGSVIYGAGVAGVHSSSTYVRTASSVYRAASGGAAAAAVGKATRAKRESFKPRPSMDALEPTHGVGAGAAHTRGVPKRWEAGFTVREEEEY